MDTALSLAASYADGRGWTILHLDYAMKLHKRGGKGRRLVLISDIGISFFKPKANIPTNTFYWIYLSKIWFKNGKIEIEFGDLDVSFETEHVESMKEFICDAVYSVMTRREFFEIKSFIDKKTRKRLPNSAVSRYLSYLEANSLTVNKKDLRLVKELELFELSSFSINSFHSLSDSVPAFLFTLPLLSSLEAISLSNCSELHESILELLFVNKSSVTQLDIADFHEHQIDRLLKKRFDLAGIKISQSSMSDDCLVLLDSFCKANTVRSLGLTCLPEFSPNIFASEYFRSSLVCLDLSDNLIEDFTFLEKLRGLLFLRLRNCKIEIEDVFTTLVRIPDSRLMTLDLSCNLCSRFEISSLSSLEHLTGVIVDKVQWKDSLSAFMTTLCGISHKGLLLSMSDIIVATPELEYFYKTLKSTPTEALTGFIWRNNLCSDDLMAFLENAPNLETLNFDGSIRTKTDITLFARSVLRMKSLNYLSIRHCSLEAVLSIISRLRIRYLDISDTDITDEFVLTLPSFFSSIQNICFDKTAVSSASTLMMLAESMSEQDVCISFPLEDFRRLRKSGSMSPGEEQTILSLWRDSKCGLCYSPEPTLFPEHFNEAMLKRIQSAKKPEKLKKTIHASSESLAIVLSSDYDSGYEDENTELKWEFPLSLLPEPEIEINTDYSLHDMYRKFKSRSD